MMKDKTQVLSLVNPEHNQQFLARIEQLHPGSQRLWGKMTVSQMLHHCLLPLELAASERKMRVNRFLAFFGPLSKLFFTHQKRFSKNLPTAPALVIRHEPDFEVARSALHAKVAHFGAHGMAAYGHKPHPIFGKMSPEEWNELQTKHLDHHLRQFGV